MNYQEAIKKLVRGQTLTEEQAGALMLDMLDGAWVPEQVAAFLTALAVRGESAEELAGFARTVLDRAITLDVEHPLLDTCGTGGSGLDTVNTSTMVAFVLAAFDVRVAKHGNRASTGKCGSMDVLEAMGTPIAIPPRRVERLIEMTNVGFLFAPLHHPGLGSVGLIRKRLGFRTAFNLVGPLANPARVQHQLLGVSDNARAPAMLEALQRLGIERAIVASGFDGLDEISVTAPTWIHELVKGRVVQTAFTLDEVGLTPAPPEAIKGGDRAMNAQVFTRVLQGRDTSPIRDLVALNAGAALKVADRAESIREGYYLACDILAAGAPFEAFDLYRRTAVALGEEDVQPVSTSTAAA